MELTPALRALLLVDHQPLGLALGTHRTQLKKPDYFRPSTSDHWNFAGGAQNGIEVAWTIDPGRHLLSEARVVISPKAGTGKVLVDELIALFTGEFGKPRALKRNEERAWTIEAELKSTLSLSLRGNPNMGGVIVVNLALAKGQKITALTPVRMSAMTVPASLETLMAKNFDVKLGVKSEAEEPVELKFSDAKNGFPKKGTLSKQVAKAKLTGVTLELPDFEDEEVFADAHAALVESLSERLGKPKSSKKANTGHTRVEALWPLEGANLLVWGESSVTEGRQVGVVYTIA
jgi:hypothetical protein